MTTDTPKGLPQLPEAQKQVYVYGRHGPLWVDPADEYYYTADQMQAIRDAGIEYGKSLAHLSDAPEGGAVAWIDDGGMKMLSRGKLCRVLPERDDDFCHALYTHPAATPAHSVDEAMVKAAEDFYYDNAPFNGPLELRAAIRGMLRAALRPSADEEPPHET